MPLTSEVTQVTEVTDPPGAEASTAPLREDEPGAEADGEPEPGYDDLPDW